MRKGRVLSLKSFALTEFLQKNYILLIIFFFLGLGIILGTFRFDSTDFWKSYFNDYLGEFISRRSEASFWRVFITCFLEALSQLFLLFLLGTSFFGVITIPAAMLLKGFLQGGVAAFLYSQYGLRGIAFNAVILIPSTLAFLIIAAFFSREAVDFSLKLSSLTLNRAMAQNLSLEFKGYCIRFSFFAVLILVASVLEALIAVGLIKNFSLV